MYEIPLFPLNLVLFPGTPIQLHIFEPRYIEMVRYCLQEKKPFGIALIRNGVESLGPLAEPFYIGCSAQIARVEDLPDGRMNLIALGQERFRVLSIDRQTKPFLVARVQSYPIEPPDLNGFELKANQLRSQFDRFIQMLVEAGTNQLDLSQLPQDDISLAYLAAAVLQISPLQKQELLAMDRADRLIERLHQHYLRELALLEVVLSNVDYLQAGGFSRN
jgi:Lon protease-like protein